MQGYLTRLKGLFVDALQQTFDGIYPEEDFRGVHVSIEYPIDKMSYPGVWVDYEDVDDLKIAGVDHTEYVRDDNGGLHEVTRWEFSGFVSFTITALTSLERDRLFDELVSTIAFGRQDPIRGRLKAIIETNDFLAVNMQFDQIQVRGNTAAPGTPWGTDEIIYERSIQVEVIGEFVPNPDPTGEPLALLSSIIVAPQIVLPGESPEELVDYDDAAGPTRWH